jgi:hypothetical protein
LPEVENDTFAVGQERHGACCRLSDPLGWIEPIYLEKSDPTFQPFDFLELVITSHSALPKFLDFPRIRLRFGIIGDSLGEEVDTEMFVLADFSTIPGQHLGKFLAARDGVVTFSMNSSVDFAFRRGIE